MTALNNNTLRKISSLFLKKQFVIAVYILVAVIAASKQYLHHSYNNYLIFKYTFWHSIEFKNLYLEYAEYLDSNHYGPLFGLLIAPFALLPDGVGTILWNIFNVSILLWGILSLPVSQNKRILIAWICLHESLTALLSFQFNVALTGCILLSFSYIIKQKESKSAFFIVLGTFVKLYGIVGLAFFFFSKHKVKFILSGIVIAALLFAAPMLLSSPKFLVQSYQDWYTSLRHKNDLNAVLNSGQDISVMGIVRRITRDASIPTLPFLLTGLTLFGLPYLRISQYKNLHFRFMLLASTLIFTVIFSSGSESPTYIIAFAGVAIWFIIQPTPKKTWIITLFIFAFLLTSMSPSDLFPRFIRVNYVQHYSLKALPCVIIWLVIIFQMLKEDYRTYPSLNT